MENSELFAFVLQREKKKQREKENENPNEERHNCDLANILRTKTFDRKPSKLNRIRCCS